MHAELRSASHQESQLLQRCCPCVCADRACSGSVLIVSLLRPNPTRDITQCPSFSLRLSVHGHGLGLTTAFGSYSSAGKASGRVHGDLSPTKDERVTGGFALKPSGMHLSHAQGEMIL